MDLPYSQACENNKQPILTVLKRWLTLPATVFEVGAGTGQHSVYFAKELPHLQWLCGDLPQNLPGIKAWQQAYPQTNLAPPIAFDMRKPAWPVALDAVYSSNTAHILPWALTRTMIAEAAAQLPAGGLLLLYGPFNYAGRFTSDSNEGFDAWLRASNPEQGIRDFEQINAVAQSNGLTLQEDSPMPANNRLLVWRK